MTADFTSALFLGLTHPSESLSWSTLTTGTPAALRRPADAAGAARDFSALVGCDRALVLSSTLHAFSDLLGALWRPPTVIFCDEAVYPIARWTMERAEQRGARVVAFRHLDPGDLEERVRRTLGTAAAAAAAASDRPVVRRGWSPPSRSERPPRPPSFAVPVWVVTDGFCAGCARWAPLDAYAALLRRWSGLLVVDDAQAIGLWGSGPTVAAPYGHGGGGALGRFPGLADSHVLLVASLAKALGAPLTMVAGAATLIETFAAASETLVHCSPPPSPVLAAACRAPALAGGGQGEALRARLAARVRLLRQALRDHGLAARGDLFPMQRLPAPDAPSAIALQEALARWGVQTVVRRSRCNDEISVTLIVTARHEERQLHRAAAALAAALRGGRLFSVHAAPFDGADRGDAAPALRSVTRLIQPGGST